MGYVQTLKQSKTQHVGKEAPRDVKTDVLTAA